MGAPLPRAGAPRPRDLPEPAAHRSTLDVLIPTRNRPTELAVTLAGLGAQDDDDRFGIIVSDQSDGTASYDTPAARAVLRTLHHRGHAVRLGRHLPRRGLAEHRQALLDASGADLVLCLDDDVWLAPGTIARLRRALAALGCGFVGNAVVGMSHVADRRPAEWEPYEEWPGRPVPEAVGPGSPAMARWTLHNAANPLHLAEHVLTGAEDWRAYKVAWVSGCVLYDRLALVACGGYDFWSDLPVEHAGEDVAAQWRVMRRFGGAGVLPSGAVHLESPTTVPDREAQATALPEFHRAGDEAGSGRDPR
ncbi:MULTISPECIES: glycosyltransferase family A protein [Actinoalloteichus]|uniref:Glycosyltransferase like family 2 n=1 Tax=Actinoalloteichus caeruleus DSM 43889 TaxID=1120930 RepID=A0ABT1JC16_ACTCY|nr:glycosyltransferase [Actinoalloteichus caeruleus]MCP2329839.1 Glycosyltransferase like family 2 [Actinoalloteichus caeruleus DSM 43889]